MTQLADIQGMVQAAILGESASEAESLLAEPPHGGRHARFDVYRKAYLLRLKEFLQNDYETLRVYLGEERFARMARDYARAYPSDTPNARWYSRHLPTFLRTAPGFGGHPEVVELAVFERALNDVFDDAEALPLTFADLAMVPPEEIGTLAFGLVPASRFLSLATNATSIWSALRIDETPPPAESVGAGQHLLVWRQAGSSRFRILGAEELMALTCIQDGLDFAHVCEMISVHDGAEDAALRAASYLRGWVEAELLMVRSEDG